MNSAQGFSANESLHRFDTQHELARSKGLLSLRSAPAEAIQVLGNEVPGTVDDAKVLRPSALHRGLEHALVVIG